MKKQPNPQPVVVSEVCSVCGENWALHIPDAQGNVSLIECIRVLKARPLISQTITTPWYPTTLPQTYPVWYRSGTSTDTSGWTAQGAITCSSTAVN